MPHIPVGRPIYYWVTGINPAGKRQLVGPCNTRSQIDQQVEEHELEATLIKKLTTRDSGKASQHFRNQLAKRDGWRSTLERFSHGKKPEDANEARQRGELFDEGEE